MKPDYDKQINPRWPNNTEGPTDRARRVAGMYRARLGALDRNARDEADRTAASFGETWMLEREQIIESDRELTTAEAAELVHVHPDTIRKWACMINPERPGERLLPRTGRRGRQRTYLAVNVLAAAATMRRLQHARAQT